MLSALSQHEIFALLWPRAGRYSQEKCFKIATSAPGIAARIDYSRTRADAAQERWRDFSALKPK
jgi:hypothetical protein